ncbi:MAG: O-antigen ligase family protein [Candidatus Magasanikbacteria bacterium]|nr:O-antigen ligase family protein [Candidatus Magasanikbacteria bacterium]
MISVLLVFDNHISTALKYLLRMMVFPYIAFVTVPLFIITDSETLKRTLKLWVGVGVIIAVFGWSSLLFSDAPGWTRLRPYAIADWTPLGVNHNLLAEAMVVLAPIAFGLFIYYHKRRPARHFAVLAVLFVVTGILTFSRAGWVGFAIQGAWLGYVYRSTLRLFWQRHKEIILIIAVPAVLLASWSAAVFFRSEAVLSSNDSRLSTLQIAAYYFRQAPLFGHGPGTYTLLLGDTDLYQRDFGEPLEAHGFLSKILVEEGLVGVVLFGGFLYWVLRELCRAQAVDGSDQPLFLGLFLSCLGIVVFELFNTSYFQSPMWLPLGVALAASHLPHADDRRHSPACLPAGNMLPLCPNQFTSST